MYLFYRTGLLLVLLLSLGRTAQAQLTCPGLPTSRMVISQSGRVVSGDAVNFRAAPSTSGSRIGQIPGGQAFEVLDGPACADGYAWWHVNYNGQNGWVVEGSRGQYWLEPIITESTAPAAASEPEPTPEVDTTDAPAAQPDTPPVLEGDGVLFSDNFDTNDAGWNVQNEFALNNQDYGLVFFDGDPTLRFVASPSSAPRITEPFEMRVNFNGGVCDTQGTDDCLLLLTFNNGGSSAYELQYGLLKGSWSLLNRGTVVDSGTIPANIPSLMEGGLHILQLLVDTNRVELRVDGLTALHSDTAVAIDGTFGFGLERTPGTTLLSGAFDDVMVTSLGYGEPLVFGMNLPITENTLYAEDFTDIVGWQRGGTLRDGGLLLAFNSDDRRGVLQRIPLDVPSLTEPFEVSLTISDVQASENNTFMIGLYMNERGIETGRGLGASYDVAALRFLVFGTSWAFMVDSIITPYPPVSFPLPAGMNLADGGTHTILWRISQPMGEVVRLLLYIDGELVANFALNELAADNFVSFFSNDAYIPLFTELDGTLGLVAGISNRGSGSSVIDDVVVERFVARNLPAGTGVGEATVAFESEIPRLELYTPQDWVAFPRQSALNPNIDYRQAYTITMFNDLQGITGAANEIGFSLVDPVLVTATSLIPDTRIADLETVLQAYTRNADGSTSGGSGDAMWDALSIETVNLSGREAVMGSVSTPNGDLARLAFRSSDNRANIITFEMSSGQLADFRSTILNITAKIDYPAPSQDYDGPEAALLEHLTFAYLGQMDSAVNVSCAADVLVIQGLGLLLEDMGRSGAGPAFDPLFNVEGIDFTVDTSGLFLESIGERPDGAVNVRVGGVVTRRYANGREVAIPHALYFVSGYAQYFGSQTFQVRREANRWARCTGLF